MRRNHVIAIAICVGCTSSVAPRPPERKAPVPTAPQAIVRAAPYLTSARIAATASGALVIDADSGKLLAIDQAGKVLAQRDIGRGAGQLVYDPYDKRLYVADRMTDRIVVLDESDLGIVLQWATPTEPYGVALTPDRKTVIVTTIADRRLVAFDAKTGTESWRARISSGARGVSITPSGTLALVSTVANGWLDLVELTGEHRAAEIPYDLACERCQDTGAFARGSGAVRFIDEQRAIATFQRSIPEALIDTRTGVYGGGSRPPVTQHVAFFTFSSDPAAPGVGQRVARIAEHQARGFVWDDKLDTAYMLGFGSDTLLKLPKAFADEASTVESQADNFALGTAGRCGPESVALAPDGDVLVWCAFTRSVLRLHDGELRQSGELVASAMTPQQQRGQVLFYGTTHDINRDRALACSSCHIDGATDGLSWKIGPEALQTPILAGRLTGTHPYKWDGTDATLAASFSTTVQRLGGRGLSAEQSDALSAFLLSLPRPRSPSLSAAAVARGEAVFNGAGACSSCHGGPMHTDGQRNLGRDTPSLVGLSASAPYYHDGSATTLESLLAGGGTVRGMGELDKLAAEQREDLLRYLESL